MDLRLYLVSGDVPLGSDLIDVLEQAALGGAATIQLRLKGASPAERVRRAAEAAERLAPIGTTFVVNDDIDAALAVEGAGLHVGPDDLHPAAAREALGPDRVIGWSLHDLAQLDDAEALAASDYLAVSPVWPTPTKPDTTAPWGLDGVRRLRDAVPPEVPLLAIGGIDATNAASVIDAGADGICVVSAICAAPDPYGAAIGLRRVVDAALDERSMR
ncbi:thiamine-phosphate pyrophosphorylase [Mumia flava]|uniref:Thiamine-phosphate synthase n=1 Tax=Mumia flava TaxID=1348852 RepID=A0A2M9B7Y2_9ACTN|nr:thiamine phosphate synthase [Mumia flava]PJJ54079.1 thiamine-phosphate pyrophosphorylase [Mumia flava]